MLWVVLCIFLLNINTLFAEKFNVSQSDTIQDFVINNGHLYVTVDTSTYLLNTSLGVINQYSKRFSNCAWLYYNADHFMECGIRLTDADICCYKRNSTTLAPITSSSNSTICALFTDKIFYYPFYVPATSSFFLLISYYSGDSHILRIGSEFDITKTDALNILKHRPIAISPSFDKYEKYIVVLRSKYVPYVKYFDANVNSDAFAQANSLNCDSSNSDGIMGFALPADSSLKITVVQSEYLMHFILYQDGVDYRICVFAEGGNDMRADDMGQTFAVNKTHIITISKGEIAHISGVIVNAGLAVYYAIGNDLFKLVMTQGDSELRTDTAVKPIYTAPDTITKIVFQSPYKAFASAANMIESFEPYQCSHLTCADCTTIRDPHCGWCTLQTKCSVLTECRMWSMWTQDSNMCLVISIAPNHKDVMAGQQLTLTVENIALPSNEKYTCKYEYNSDVTEEVSGTFAGGTLTFPIPALSVATGLVVVNVSLYFEEIHIGNTVKINYHQCDLYKDCSDCSMISKYCTWCPLEGSCTLNNKTICQENAVTEVSKCPLITRITPTKIARMTGKQVVLYVENLPPFKISTSSNVYKCKVSSKTGKHSQVYDIGPNSTNDTIFCIDVLINNSFPEYYEAESRLLISVIYSPNNAAVVQNELSVYACELLTFDCVECVSMYSSTPYECRYCTDTCAYVGSVSCDDGTVIATDAYDCLQNTTVLEKVVPSWSPGEGGVPVTLFGNSLTVDGDINIQFKFTDSIIVDCAESIFISSTELTCLTPSVMKTFNQDIMIESYVATIIIKYKSGNQPEEFVSLTEFTFSPMDIDLVLPSYGPKSGSTLISVSGNHVCHPESTGVTVGDKECAPVSCNLTTQTIQCPTPPGTGTNQTINVTLGDGAVSVDAYEYRKDPVIHSVEPNCTLSEGGINLTVTGTDFDVIQRPLLIIGDRTLSCKQSIEPRDAKFRNSTHLIYTLPPRDSSFYVAFSMDGVTALCETKRAITLRNSPSLINSNVKDRPCQIGDVCLINIQMTQIHLFEHQVLVSVGEVLCVNTTIYTIDTGTVETGVIGNLSCVAPSYASLRGAEGPVRTKRAASDQANNNEFRVMLKIGDFRFPIGLVKYQEKGVSSMVYAYAAAGVLALILLAIVAVVVKNRTDKNKMSDMEKKHRYDLDTVEAVYADRARSEFTELTLMKDNITDVKINPNDIPYRVFSDYLIHIMFPTVDKRKILNNLQSDVLDISDYQLTEFKKMLNNTQFLLTFIEIIEAQRDFQVTHRCEVASYMTCALYGDFNYLSHVLFRLLDKLVEADIKKSPKLLLRATKSVAEKLLTNWLSLSLYNYLYTVTGPSLYKLCYTITLTVEQGPLDCVTHHAKYSLSQDKLLSEKVEYTELLVEGEGPDGVRSNGPVSVLDCDTITQVKGKIYRAIYKHQYFSQQPNIDTVSLLWIPAESGQYASSSMELADVSELISDPNGENRYNTLKTYKVKSGDLLKLTLFNEFHQAPMGTIRSAKRQTVSEFSRYHIVKNNHMDLEYKSPATKRQASTTKIASEAFLPSLIRTKEHLKGVLANMINTIFMESNNIPPAIKYLFDYLDNKTELLSEKERADPEIAHIWKTNSLPLRFWINIMKNPQFLFDIEKAPIMDSYLSVIGQCFMDSCSRSSMMLNKDSSANKLVYNREVTVFRDIVNKWYNDVRQSPKVNLRTVVHDSKLPHLPFKHKFAVSQLFNYATKYAGDIADALPLVPSGDHEFTRSDFEVLLKNRT